jgi:hypothetical protein
MILSSAVLSELSVGAGTPGVDAGFDAPAVATEVTCPVAAALGSTVPVGAEPPPPPPAPAPTLLVTAPYFPLLTMSCHVVDVCGAVAVTPGIYGEELAGGVVGVGADGPPRASGLVPVAPLMN